MTPRGIILAKAENFMRADRLLSALLLLQAHGRLTGREMARRLEVSQRTVHRDMEALSAAGIPVYAVRGTQGGWRLDEQWRTDVPGLDDAELRALLMSQPRLLGDPRLVAAAESAIRKLMAALPAAMRSRAAAISQRIFVDIEGWHPASEDLGAMPVVQEAVWSDRRLAFDYRRPGGETASRTVDPLGLVAKGPAWYLFAATAKGFRTFRVSRIERPRMLEEPVRRPVNFDLAAQWKASTERFHEDRRRYLATLELDAIAIAWVRQWRTATLQVAGPEWSAFEVEFGCEEEGAFVVLGLASHARVIAPSALHDRVEREKRLDGRVDLRTVMQKCKKRLPDVASAGGVS
jgi:predicted DNA-binding transcriptional regulator YafY